MMFFTGMHHPHNGAKVRAAFISVHALERRKSGFPVHRWVMDSGAFTTIAKHGGYPEPVEKYAEQIKRFARNGRLLAAVSQDYMCEPIMLKKTGLTIADHQRLTIERYDALLQCDRGGVPIIPVLQGYAPTDYINHIIAYGDRLKYRMWVGVGSICKRNSSPKAIEEVLRIIKVYRPDLRLHGFGIKLTALASPIVRGCLFSADSMAWSFGARRRGGGQNDPRLAREYADRVNALCSEWDTKTWKSWCQLSFPRNALTETSKAGCTATVMR